MNLSEKLLALRKARAMSQEELAEHLDVSRQAVSRWEQGTAMPDAANLLQLSRLFGVSVDYLLNDEYQSDNDLPKVQEVRRDQMGTIMAYLVALEVMILLMQFMTFVILQSAFFGVLSVIPFVAVIGGFEYAHRRQGAQNTEKTKAFRVRFYKISAWLGLYFPVRFVVSVAVRLWPRPFSALALECVIAVLYLCAVMLVHLTLDKRGLKGTEI